ncbi:putative signal transducing protein [Phocaeicola paurosaccharolyticus]|jgi:hypothetical protein|uniref:putative signal transducing protein n=1 Tax=Phocaeicola paurosaccharolyticus TaxID=732242 RepID=UPI000468B7B4|nr:DUF2007 domain-containing protein [Phocaeicola paurosaccharolyticus]
MEMEENDAMAVVKVCDNYVQAEIIQGNLISKGLHAEIYDNGMESIMENEGIPVLVPKDEYEKAKEIIGE